MHEVVDHAKINDCFKKEFRYCVDYSDKECEVKCTCRSFEFRGILCTYALIVLTMIKNVDRLPSIYILDRWRKDLKQKYVFVNNCYHDKSDNPEARIYDELCNDF